MKNKITFITTCILINVYVFSAFAQSNVNENQLIQLGKVDSLHSNILNESRQIWVQVPESAKTLTNHPNKYPVLYVLDGGEHFLSVCSILKQLAPGTLPEMIIVGIGNFENRTRDLTPTKVVEARGASDWVKNSGGGERFTSFIEKELIPYIDNKYPTANYKTLIGHSFGGLLVVNTLINHSELFENYIAIDPSLWWDNEVLSKDITKKLINEKYKNKSLFISLANPLPPDKEKELGVLIKNKTQETEGLHAIYNFSKLVATSEDSKLKFKYKYYEDENHGTVPLISIYDGIKFLFPWYKMSSQFVDVIQNPNSTATDFTNAFNKRFKKISNKLGYKVYPEEDMLNSLGYMFLSREPNKSLLFFNMAVEYYPKSANVYDSLADYYLAKKEYDRALKNVTKAYEINAIDYYKKRMQDITKMK
jgi:predicted alpha/beta superfamily hydrolase